MCHISCLHGFIYAIPSLGALSPPTSTYSNIILPASVSPPGSFSSYPRPTSVPSPELSPSAQLCLALDLVILMSVSDTMKSVLEGRAASASALGPRGSSGWGGMTEGLTEWQAGTYVFLSHTLTSHIQPWGPELTHQPQPLSCLRMAALTSQDGKMELMLSRTPAGPQRANPRPRPSGPGYEQPSPAQPVRTLRAEGVCPGLGEVGSSPSCLPMSHP